MSVKHIFPTPSVILPIRVISSQVESYSPSRIPRLPSLIPVVPDFFIGKVRQDRLSHLAATAAHIYLEDHMLSSALRRNRLFLAVDLPGHLSFPDLNGRSNLCQALRSQEVWHFLLAFKIVGPKTGKSNGGKLWDSLEHSLAGRLNEVSTGDSVLLPDVRVDRLEESPRCKSLGRFHAQNVAGSAGVDDEGNDALLQSLGLEVLHLRLHLPCR